MFLVGFSISYTPIESMVCKVELIHSTSHALEYVHIVGNKLEYAHKHCTVEVIKPCEKVRNLYFELAPDHF